jgi:hypothetical protein
VRQNPVFASENIESILSSPELNDKLELGTTLRRENEQQYLSNKSLNQKC